MPDITPDPTGPITSVIDRAQERLGELNVALAYSPGLPNLEEHLLVVQDLMSALDALRSDV